jgi:hypothetical protein
MLCRYLAHSLLAEGDRTPFFLSLRSEMFQIERNLSYGADTKNPDVRRVIGSYFFPYCSAINICCSASVTKIAVSTFLIPFTSLKIVTVTPGSPGV